MSAEPVKLPLAVKKAIRDYEPTVATQLAELTALVGSPVKYEFDWPTLWTALEGNSNQARIPMAVIEYYMKGLINLLKKSLSDDLVKKAFVSQFTTGVITFSIVDEKYSAPEKELATWNLYNGLRFVNGKLDFITKEGRFFSNVDYIETETKLVDLLANVPGELPLAITILIRDETAQREAVLARIAKATGVDRVTWDTDADYKDFVKMLPERVKNSPQALLQYITGLAVCIERECKDDMVKEAIVDAFGAKKVSIRCVPSMKAVSGLKMDDMYTGVQIDGGVITAMSEPSRWYSNLDHIERHQLVNLF